MKKSELRNIIKEELQKIFNEMTLIEGAKKYLFGHNNFNNAYLVEDYPYGFKLRTQLKAWLETHPKRGDRFVTVTLNPKTNRWNKPKASTYAPIGVMYLDEKGHVTWTAISEYSEEKEIKQFIKDIGGESKLNKSQLIRYKEMAGEDAGEIAWKHKFEKNSKSGETVILDLRFDVINRLNVSNIVDALDTLIKKNKNEFRSLIENDGIIRVFGRKGVLIAGPMNAEKTYKQLKSKLKNKI